jgi:hypothetical protein
MENFPVMLQKGKGKKSTFCLCRHAVISRERMDVFLGGALEKTV